MTNPAGYRSHSYPIQKAPGTFRIVGLGDSVMMGWGVGEGENYMALVEKTLAKQFPQKKIEVINLAVPGYNSVQEYYTLRDTGLLYSPDVIILGYVGNDLENTPTRDCTLSPIVRGWRRLSRTFTARWRALRNQPNPDILPSREEERVVFKNALEGIARLAQRDEIPVILLMDSRYESALISHRQVAQMGKALHMLPINLFSLYRNIPEGTPFEKAVTIQDAHNQNLVLELFPKDNHPNAKWHQKTALQIAMKGEWALWISRATLKMVH